VAACVPDVSVGPGQVATQGSGSLEAKVILDNRVVRWQAAMRRRRRRGGAVVWAHRRTSVACADDAAPSTRHFTVPVTPVDCSSTRRAVIVTVSFDLGMSGTCLMSRMSARYCCWRRN